MTGRPTFGEFAAAVTSHLRQLQLRGTGLPSSDNSQAKTDAVAGVHAAVHALARYAEDACAALSAAHVTSDHSLDPWIRAAGMARQALTAADADWPDEPAANITSARLPSAGSSVSSLRAATMYMTLGRDLLHTHRNSGPGREASDWTPVVVSAPVACALMQLVGGWARQIAPHAGCLSAVGAATATDRRSLNAACRGLWVTSWAVGNAQERRPIRRDELQTLAAIPVAGLPAGVLPTASDLVPQLCEGIATTAERLRATARRAAVNAASSPSLTTESFRQTAGCCAITASNLRVILQNLAAHHGRPCAPVSAALADAAEAADRSRAAWLHVAGAWDSVSTDVRGILNAVAGEAASLALWTGRLTYSSPEWTPALGPRHAPRPSAELAADQDQLRQVLGALHYAGHAVAVVAEAEQAQARTASIYGRLVTPTRSLPESFDVPYRFAPAPGMRTAPLLSSYDQALQASEEAVEALTQIATEIRVPDRSLAANRAAVRLGLGAAAESVLATNHARSLAGAQAAGTHPVPEPAPVARGPQQLPPGPVERILLDLDVTTQADLERAAALDTAADRLILRAAAMARPSQPNRDLARSAGTAELITRLLVASDGPAPDALQPGASAVVKSRQRELTDQPYRTSIQSSARQAEPEAGG